MANKWLIVDGQFRMSSGVEFHKELLKQNENKSNTQGGGWWNLERSQPAMFLYAKSEDFGPAKKEDVIKALESARLPIWMEGIKFFISTKEWFTDAQKESEGREPDWICPS